MKKRLFALLLAGLMTASMAACVTTRGNQNTGEDTFSPPTQSTTQKPDGPAIPNPDSWKEVDKTLYAFEATAMYSDAKVSSAKVTDLPAEAELHCTLQNNYWYYVSYQNGTETLSGYVSRDSLTDVDLLAKSFTEVDGGEKTMYVLVNNKEEKINVRLYPCTDDFSTVVGTLSWNEEVTVVSENGEWSRIKVTEGSVDKYYFVASDYLDDEKQIDWNDVSQWEHLFTDCATPLTKYVNGNTANLRKAPNAQADGIEILTLDMEVTVKKTAQIGESNWSYVEVWMPEKKVGDGPYLAKGYINSRLLSDKTSTAPATLDELLERYPGAFEALDAPKTMYSAGSTNVRSTPLFPNVDEGEKSNIVATLSKADEVTVVANGSYEGTAFYIIEFTVDEKAGFYFVSAKTLTTDPTGAPTVTLEDLTDKYPDFEICTETTAVTKSTANCYLKPDNSAQNPDLQLEAGTAVTIVARSSVDQWCVIRAENGTLYFVNSLLLEEAAA